MRGKFADFALFAALVGGLGVICGIENAGGFDLSVGQLTGEQE